MVLETWYSRIAIIYSFIYVLVVIFLNVLMLKTGYYKDFYIFFIYSLIFLSLLFCKFKEVNGTKYLVFIGGVVHFFIVFWGGELIYRESPMIFLGMFFLLFPYTLVCIPKLKLRWKN